ncbi:hypothetical protein JCM8547_002586 [Rhodosporidiobolus lusitaniae]
MLSLRAILPALAVYGFASLSAPPVMAQPAHVDTLPFVVQNPNNIPTSGAIPSLADLLTRSKRSRWFYDYARDSTAVSTILIDLHGSTTLLAPVDAAIVALPRKPHEGPAVAESQSGEVSSNEEERQRAEYLEAWVKNHCVLERVELEEGDWEARDYTTMSGKKVKFAAGGENGEGRVLLPGDVEVVGEEMASNGKILYLQGTITVD